MVQTYTADCYDPSNVGDTDLTHMEENFAALKSSFSGGSQPSNAVAGMLWLDTTQKVLKNRDQANSAWYGLMHGDTSQKIWVYRNTAMDGWVVDSTVTDVVIAIKGGSNAYNVAGAQTAGSWSHAHTISSTSHNHYLKNDTIVYPSYNADTDDKNEDYFATVYDGQVQVFKTGGGSTALHRLDDLTVSQHGASSTTSTVSAWRPAAAVGTLQRLDL